MRVAEYRKYLYDLHIPVRNGVLAESLGLKCNNGCHRNTKIDKYYCMHFIYICHNTSIDIYYI